MANDDPQTPPPLGPWLQKFLNHSGLSRSAIARAMDVDRSNVRDWLDGKSGMNAQSLLAFLDAVGAEISPVEAPEAPRAMNSEMAELRRHLEALEGKVAELPTAEDLKKATGTLRAAIDRLAKRDKPVIRPTSKKSAGRG